MIRDRGNIKWTAMMLPEHVTKLRDWMVKDHYVERPELDEWDLQGIQGEIELAYKRQCDTVVTIWCKGMEVAYIGKISKLDQRLNLISIDGPFGEDRLPVGDVIKVECRDW